MEQKKYVFYKKIMVRYLSNNYVVVKNETPTETKYKIVTKVDNVKTAPETILNELKKIFNLEDDKSLKKIINFWSKRKLTKKNWSWEFNLSLPSGLLFYMDFVCPTQEVPFEPRLSLSSRYSSKKVSDKSYITINIQPHVPPKHIELDININNEKFKE
jgi:hypothetical protein